MDDTKKYLKIITKNLILKVENVIWISDNSDFIVDFYGSHWNVFKRINKLPKKQKYQIFRRQMHKELRIKSLNFARKYNIPEEFVTNMFGKTPTYKFKKEYKPKYGLVEALEPEQLLRIEKELRDIRNTKELLES